MKQLFFRFYVGIALVLVGAALFLGYVTRLEQLNQAKMRLRDIYYPMVLKARKELIQAGDDLSKREQALASLRNIYPFQVAIVPRTVYHFEPAQIKHLRGGMVVRRDTRTRPKLFCMLNAEEFLVFGPVDPLLPRGMASVIVIFVPILALVGLAIFLLLRSLQRRIYALSQVAHALGEGRLEARAEVGGSYALDTLGDGFNRMADRIQQVLNGRQELLQTAFHEIRTPLMRLMFLLAEARSGGKRHEPHELYLRMDQSLGDIHGLVEELREEVFADLSGPHQTWVDVPDLLQEVRDSAALDGRVEVVCSSELAVMTGMESALRRALQNLVGNSMRYASSCVRITAFTRSGQTCLCVEDDGPGIPQKEWGSVFKPGYRLPGDDRGGTGLGLSLVHRIAHRHGGRIILDHSPLGGARFTMVLPEQELKEAA